MLTEKQIVIAAKMFELRDTMKRLLGEKWDAKTADMRAILSGVMRETGDNNPLSAVLPIAKAMSAAGENPALLMAVAVDMADQPTKI